MIPRKIAAIVLAFVIAFRTAAVANGIPFIRGGQRIDGATSVLTLTNEQSTQLHKGNLVALTDAQRAELLRRAGYSPDSIVVLSMREAKTTCTCEQVNIGVRFANGKVEVPLALLGPDIYSRPLLQGKDWWLRARRGFSAAPANPAEQGHALNAQENARK